MTFDELAFKLDEQLKSMNLKFFYANSEDMYCCIYDFTIKNDYSGQPVIYHKSNVNVRDENRLVDLMKDVIKRYKEITIELKKRELENDF